MLQQDQAIDVNYHFVREPLVAELITILKIPAKSNTSDILTTPLPAEAHWRHISSLLLNIYSEGEVCK